MKPKMLDITDDFSLTYDFFLNLCKNDCYPENSIGYMWEKLRSFDSETAKILVLEYYVDELLDTYLDVNLMYEKSEIEKKGETRRLKFRIFCNKIRTWILEELRRGSDKYFLFYMDFFKGMDPNVIYEVFCYHNSNVNYKVLCELIDVINSDDRDRKILRAKILASHIILHSKTFDYDEFINNYFSDPIKEAAFLGTYKERTYVESVRNVFDCFRNYVYADWLIHKDKFAYSTYKDVYNFRSDDIFSISYNFIEILIIESHDCIGDLIDAFFEYVLSKNIDEGIRTCILEFFSKKRISQIVQELYEKYSETHPDAVKIEFLPDKFLPIPLPKLKQWTESCLRWLYQKLIEGKFIAADTKETDFLYVFGYCNEYYYDEVEPINWISCYNNKPAQKQIIDLLVLMGYDFCALKKKPLLDSLNGCFYAAKSKEPGQGTSFKRNNFSRGHKSDKHEELECIVSEALSAV